MNVGEQERIWNVIERGGELHTADPSAPSHADAFEVVPRSQLVEAREALEKIKSATRPDVAAIAYPHSVASEVLARLSSTESE